MRATANRSTAERPFRRRPWTGSGGPWCRRRTRPMPPRRLPRSIASRDRACLIRRSWPRRERRSRLRCGFRQREPCAGRSRRRTESAIAARPMPRDCRRSPLAARTAPFASNSPFHRAITGCVCNGAAATRARPHRSSWRPGAHIFPMASPARARPGASRPSSMLCVSLATGASAISAIWLNCCGPQHSLGPMRSASIRCMPCSTTSPKARAPIRPAAVSFSIPYTSM